MENLHPTPKQMMQCAIQLASLLLLLVTYDVMQSEATWTYTVTWPQGKLTSYSYPWTSHGDCLYDRRRDVLTCMRNHGYQTVVNTWNYDPELIVYVSLRCLEPHPYPSPIQSRQLSPSLTYATPACLCKNRDHAFPLETTTHKGLTTENYYLCQLERLSPVMFDGLVELEVLDVSHNLLEHLEGNGFHSLPALKVFSLHHNPLRHLPGGLTCSLISLEVLDISYLQLSTFPGHVFRCDGNASEPVSVLRWLNVVQSHIYNVPAGSFWYLGNLQFLNMSDNLVHHLPAHPFLGAFSLQAVDLSRNVLSSLPEKFCEGIPQLTDLLLTENTFVKVELAELEPCGNLTRLDLSNNLISSLTGQPAKLPLLRELNLAHNQLHELHGALIGPNCSLHVLDLSHNNLRRVEDSVLDNMAQLVSLSLASNTLQEENFDPSRIFQNLAQLEVLNLSSNALTSVSESDFAGLTTLRVLDLSHNRIASVSFGADTSLSHVTHLNLSSNMLTSSKYDVMVHLRSLKVLDLSDNLLQMVVDLHVPQTLLTLDLTRNSLRSVPVFHGASGLHVLRLAWNSITTLTDQVLQTLEGLQELDLAHNKLFTIQSQALTSLLNLRFLQMAHNRLALNDSHAGQVFSGMQKLELLNLSSNTLTSVQGLFHPGSFAGLLELDVSHNPIRQITERLNQWNRTMHLQYIHLDSCHLHDVSADAFGDLIYLRTVNLQDNLLTRVPAFRTHVGVTYRLQGNPITCSCHMTWLKKDTVRVLGQDIPTHDYVIISCRVVPRGHFYPIRLVDSRDFLCRTETACPENCSCYSQKEAGDPEVVFCTGSLTSAPASLPKTARVISLEDNTIREVEAVGGSTPLDAEELYLNASRVTWIADDAFGNLPRLHTLYLSNNQLTNLSPHLLLSLNNLASLSLSNNELESLPAGLFSKTLSMKRLDLSHNFLTTLDPGTVRELRALDKLYEVRLSSNPWECGCTNSDMYRWITENTTRVVDYEDMVCVDQEGQSMLSVDPALFDCQDDDSPSVSVVVGIIVGVVVGVALLVVVYRCRSVLAAVCYTRLGVQGVRPRCNRAPLGLLYDVSVLYDHSDRKCRWWVEQILVPRLTSGKWRLRVHVPRTEHSRAAGGSVVDSAVYSVRQSASCLVLVSKYFGTHHHTVTCFQQAINQELARPGSLVLITWGELTKQTLECGVRQFWGRSHHLPITATFFWDRLLYLLPVSTRAAAGRRQSLISACRFRSLSDAISEPETTTTKADRNSTHDISEHL